MLKDKKSQIYQDNVSKFGVTEEYVRAAFGEETLLKAAARGKTTFYLALENNEIMGFAQILSRNAATAELDRIIIFPQHAGKGIGTRLLGRIIVDQEQKGVNYIVVNTEKEESQAKRFYEKNNFMQVNETTIDAPWGKKLTLVTYQLCLKHA